MWWRAMRESAYVLARMRATGTAPGSLGFVDGVEGAAAAAGRRLVLLRGAPVADTTLALGWDDLAEPDPDTLAFEVQRLAPSALTTLVACVACCWPDAGADPYPGASNSVRDVLAVTARLGVDRNWAKAALLHDLPGAGYLLITGRADGDEVRLGPAFATWPSGQLSLLRRAHERLCSIGGVA
jgi:hypothetical protein